MRKYLCNPMLVVVAAAVVVVVDDLWVVGAVNVHTRTAPVEVPTATKPGAAMETTRGTPSDDDDDAKDVDQRLAPCCVDSSALWVAVVRNGKEHVKYKCGSCHTTSRFFVKHANSKEV